MRHAYSNFVSLVLVICAIAIAPRAWAGCPPPEWVCAYWPPTIGMYAPTVIGGCEGPACFDMTYLSEARVVAVDDEGLFPDHWQAWHGGVLQSVSCVDLQERNKKARWAMHEARHCTMYLVTENHSYLWFLASIPDMQCLGLVECLVEE